MLCRPALQRSARQRACLPILSYKRFGSPQGTCKEISYSNSQLQQSDTSRGTDTAPSWSQKRFNVSLYVRNPDEWSSKPSLNTNRPRLSGPGIALVVLLATPPLARTVTSTHFLQDKFLPWLIDPGHEKEVCLVSAIVDQIPSPVPGPQPTGGSQAHGGYYGAHGLSIHAVNSSSEARRILGRVNRDSSQTAGVIQFLFSKKATISDAWESKSSGSETVMNHKVTLPLASTIFETGLEHTLAVQSWKASLNSNGSKTYKLNGSYTPTQVSVDMSPETDYSSRSRIRYSHMVGLTPFRAVIGSMGNVLKTLAGSEENPESMPASRELEVCIPQFLARTGVKSYEIWAEVVPRGALPQQPSHTLFDMLLSNRDPISLGHRFHRVVSGGGGWGEKQGLVALKPDDGFNDSSNKQSEDSGLPESFGDMLKPVASPGDFVRFHAVIRQEGNTAAVQYRKSVSAYTFGSIGGLQPDTEKQPAEPQAKMDSTSNTIYAKGAFGALSSQNASYMVECARKDQSHRYDSIGGMNLGILTRTELPPWAVFVHWPRFR